MQTKFKRKTKLVNKPFRYQALGLLLIITGITLLMNQTRINNYVSIREYGDSIWIHASPKKIIPLERIKNYRHLLKVMNHILCKDETPVLQFQTDKHLIKRIYPVNFCPYSPPGCILIRPRNIIEINHKYIFKAETILPVDSIYYALKKDYYNYGKEPGYCDNPNKLLIFINYNNRPVKELITTLDRLTCAYDSLQIHAGLKLEMEGFSF